MPAAASRPTAGLVRIAVVTLGGILLMWLSIAVTLAMTTAASLPRAVLALWPAAVDAKTAIAWTMMTQTPTSAAGDEAAPLAGAALVREPVSASAASGLGTAASLRSEEPRAETAFVDAQRLSRRDLQAQLWFIEHSVQRGNVEGALDHYDIALRTTPSAATLLLPVLARASNEAAIRRPLIARLRRNPGWRGGYLQAMLQAGLTPVAVAEQIAGSGLDPADAGEARIISDGLAQLVRAGQYRLATAALPGAATAPALRNAGFERPPDLLPFDWWLSNDSDLVAYRDPASIGEGAYVLRITANARGGPVARQLVTLPEGRFMLSGIAGNTGDAGAAVPSIAIACVDRRDPAGTPSPAIPSLATSSLNAAPGGTRRFSLGFTVPGNCPAQWITITTPANASVSAWVDALRLQPGAAGQG